MSTTIDKRVVEMRFDNKNFESNVQTSISTLEKLKQKLNLTGAAKGLEDINSAAKNVNMSGLGSAVDTVRTKFSALEVIGVTALANLANSAVNAGKRIVSSLTIDPIMDGFREYELTLNAIQTTMAGTGKTAKEVEAELKKLDEYADQTVYSTADMLNNLPKFTNAGVELETATKAMIGIANATAHAGGDAQKASIAFYNLGQAIGTGYLTRMDYNSINNAGIATMEWKNQMVEAAIAAGTLSKAGEDLYETGGKTFTLQQLFIDGLQKQWATTDVMLKVFGDYGDKTTDIGKKAYASAQNIKTFTMMMDSLKATAGTGWKDTWQIVFGDLDGATKLWTGLANAISSVITRMADWRNELLGSALGKGFSSLSKKLKTLSKPMGKVSDAMKTASEALKSYNDIVKEIINGDWGNGQERWDKLTKAGYDWAHAQNLVNEKLGVSVRHTTKYTEEQGKNAQATADLTEKEAKYIAQLAVMSDAELKALGYTEEQIKAFRELKEAAEKLGLPLEEFINKIDEIDGRWLLINSFKNIGNAFSQVAKVIKEAWTDIFPNTTEKIATGIFNVISAFHKLTTSLGGFVDDSGKLTESGEKLKRTFEGLFAAFDIFLTVTSGPMGVAFRVLREVLEALDIPILDITAAVGDVIVKFRDWLDGILDFSGVFDKLASWIKKAVDAVRDFYNAFKDSKYVEVGKNIVQGLANGIKDGAVKLWNTIVNFAKTILVKICEVLGVESPSTETYEIGTNLIQGLVNGIQNGVHIVWNAIKTLCKGMIETFKNFDWTMISDALWVVSSFFPSNKIIPIIRACANFAKNAGNAVLESFKSTLGIHSPSTKFFEIGKNILQGLVNGLKAGASSVMNFMKDLAGKMMTFFKNIDWGAVIAIGITAGMVVVAKKVLDIVDILAAPLEGIGKLTSGIGNFFDSLGKAFTDKFKAEKMKATAQIILAIGISIGILVASIYALTKLDTGETWAAIGAITVLAAVISGLAVVVGKFGPKQTADLGKLSVAMLSMSGSILLIAFAFKQLSELDWEGVKKGAAGIGVVTAAVLILMASTKLFNTEATKLGGTLLLMATSVALLGFVAKQFSKMSWGDLGKAAAGIGGMVVIMSGLMLLTKLGGKHIDGAGATILKMSIAIGLMLVVAKLAASMDPETMITGGLAIVAFGGIVTGLIAATRLAGGKDLTKVGTTLLAMSASIVLLALVAKMLSTMDVQSLVKGVTAVTVLGGIITGLVAATRLAGGNNLKGVSSTLLAMSISIGILGGIAAILGLVEIEHLAKGIVAVGLLSGMMALLAASTRGAQDCKANLIVMTVAIGLLVAALIGLTFIEPEKLATSAAALSVVIGMFGLLVAASKIGGQAGASVGQLASLLGVVAILSAIVAALAFIPNPEAALKNAAAVSLLMTSLSVALGIINLTGKNAAGATKGLVPMLAVVTGLAAILGVLAYLEVEPSIQTVAALSIMLNSMAVAMAILSLVGPSASQAVGAMALLGLVVGELGVILGLMAHFDVQPSIETVSSLSTLLLAMSGTLVILGVVGTLGPAAYVGVGALATLIATLGVVLTALGGLSKIDGFNELIRDGGETLSLIGYALGNFVGSIVGGLSAGLLSGLPEIGTHLSEFMTNVKPFIEGVKTFDESALNGVKALAGAILALTAADLISGMLSLKAGGASFGELGTELADFMTNAKPFIEGAALLNSDMVSAVKALAETILILTAADVLQGLTSTWFGSDNSLATFGSQLGGLGTNLNEFATNLGTFDESKVTSITCAANAIKAMAEAADAIPDEGGWIAKICGDNSIATFGGYLPSLGTNLAAFATNLGTFDAVQQTSIACAADAIKAMAEAANEIPNDGGWVAKLLGDNSLATFGGQLPGLGANLSAFATNLGTFDDTTVTTVTCAANAIKAIAQASEGIDGQAEWAKKIFGDNGLATFGDQLGALGTNLAAFATNLGTFGEDKVATVKSAVSAVKAFAELANADLKGAKKNLGDFGDKLGGLATDIADFCTNMPSGEALTAVVNNIKKLLSAIADIASAKTDTASKFTKSMKELGTDGVKAFTSGISSDSSKSDAKKAGATLTEQVEKGVESRKNDVKSAGKEVAGEAADGMGSKEVISSAESAGKDLGNGLVAGIKAKETAAYNAGYALGQAAVQGEKDGQQSNSPSKLTIQAGKWIGEGLIVGMAMMAKSVYRSGSELGETSTKSISTAISAISSAINGDMDMQPTIRPVIDLSDVEAGAAAIGGMFSATPSVGVLSSVGSINSMMNGRNQNGANGEVVSAIKDLKKSIGKTSGDTYNFGDVSYSGDDDISDAVKALVRAIRVGGRV